MSRHNRKKSPKEYVMFGYENVVRVTYDEEPERKCSNCVGCEIALRPFLQDPKKNGHDYINHIQHLCLKYDHLLIQWLTPCERCDYNTASRCCYTANPQLISPETVWCRRCKINGHSICKIGPETTSPIVHNGV